MQTRFKFTLLVLLAMFMVLIPQPLVTASGGVTITVPEGSTISTPEPPGTIKVELGANGGMISLNGVDLISAPAGSTVVRHADGRVTVTVGGFTVMAPAGSTVSTPSPQGTLRIDIGATGGTINVNGVNLATASAGCTVVFNTNNTTTITVPSGGGTSITMPTSNGPIVTDNSNGTTTVVLPGQAPITIPSNGGNWYAIFFNSNGGSGVGAQIIESGTSIIIPAIPTRSGFVFADWRSDAALTTVWSFAADTVAGITTLHARWALPPSEGGPPPGAGAGTPTVQPPQTVTPPIEEVPQIMPPAEEVPAGLPPAETPPPVEWPPLPPPIEMPPVQPPPEEEITYLPVEQYEPYEAYQTNDIEPEEEHNEADIAVDDAIELVASSEYIETLPQTDYIDGDYTVDEYIEAEQVIVTFTFSNFENPVDDNVSHYRIISRQSGLRFLYGQIPAFTNGDGLFYTVMYRTNFNNSQRVMADNVPAGRPFVLSPPKLGPDEIIVEISIEFDTIPSGFGVGDTIKYSFVLLYDNATNYWKVTYGEQSIRNFIIAALLNYIDSVSGFQSRYDAESWYNLQVAIGYVKVVLDNPYSTLEELEMVYALLKQAIYGLIPTVAESPLMLRSVVKAVVMTLLLILLVFVLVKLLRYKKRKQAYALKNPS